MLGAPKLSGVDHVLLLTRLCRYFAQNKAFPRDELERFEPDRSRTRMRPALVNKLNFPDTFHVFCLIQSDSGNVLPSVNILGHLAIAPLHLATNRNHFILLEHQLKWLGLL